MKKSNAQPNCVHVEGEQTICVWDYVNKSNKYQVPTKNSLFQLNALLWVYS